MKRIIARLDIKGPNLIKGVHMEGLRVIGDPREHAIRYADQGADEILYMDAVASLYGRNQLEALLRETTEKVFIPVCVGGGIGSLTDAKAVFDAGADRVAINTAAIKRPALIDEMANYYGSQALTVSIDCKRVGQGWRAYTDAGREDSQRDAIAWAHEAIDRGAGEILLTSIDMDGTMRGPDLALLRALGSVAVPVVYCGGIATQTQVCEVLEIADAVAIASAFHYQRLFPGVFFGSEIRTAA